MIYSRAVETVRDLFFTILAAFILLATISSTTTNGTPASRGHKSNYYYIRCHYTWNARVSRAPSNYYHIQGPINTCLSASDKRGLSAAEKCYTSVKVW